MEDAADEEQRELQDPDAHRPGRRAASGRIVTAPRRSPPKAPAAQPAAPRRTPKPKATPAARAGVPARGVLAARVKVALAALEHLGDKRTREEMETRYGIVTRKAFGVPMTDMQKVAKGLGQDHDLAEALWKTGWYEARMVAAFVDDPARVTPAQMDRWCRDFDNWGICDTVCFKLFDRTPHAMAKVAQWSRRSGEFEKRAAFALLASVALHDKAADDDAFVRCLPLIERAAEDERNFVKKGVSWALRSIGRRSSRLNAASVVLSKRLEASPSAAARWIGREALREIASSTVTRRVEARRRSNAAMALLLASVLGVASAHAGELRGPDAASRAAASVASPAKPPATRADTVATRTEAPVTTRIRRPGEFCWINMLTPQPEKAREFFAALLGWTYVEIPGMGHGVRAGGRDIGGLFDLEGPNTPKGTPPLIGVMVKVENADSAAARAASLGGRSMPAFDIGPQGRMAVCFDPDGANIDVWQSTGMPGTDVDPATPGAPSWFESRTADAGRAAAFYSAWLGWAARPGPGHTTFLLGPTRVAGLATAPPRAQEPAPHWATYFTVTDVDETARRAVELGATIGAPAREVPAGGRACGITSPQGVPFFVIEYAR